MKALADFDWPGNVRELKNSMARAVILSKRTTLRPEDLPETLTEGAPPGLDPGTPVPALSDGGVSIQDMEKRLIQETLTRCAGNKSHTAARLGIARKTLYEKMARLRIR
jgi:DNA-binding NtrC family response regulator